MSVYQSRAVHYNKKRMSDFHILYFDIHGFVDDWEMGVLTGLQPPKAGENVFSVNCEGFRSVLSHFSPYRGL